MGEVMDLYYFFVDLIIYSVCINELVSMLKNVVDVWEIVNEINGEWLCVNLSGLIMMVML